jgi:hypothetical protein
VNKIIPDLPSSKPSCRNEKLSLRLRISNLQADLDSKRRGEEWEPFGAYSPENEFIICPSMVRPQILDRMY